MNVLKYHIVQPLELWKALGVDCQIVPPSPTFQRFVHYYWQTHIYGAHSEVTVPVIPDSRCQLIFEYIDNSIRAFIAGTKKVTLQMTQAVGTQRFGISLLPEHAYVLLGLPLNELQDQQALLEDLFFDGEPLKESMIAAQSFSERILCFEAWLSLRISTHPSYPIHLTQLLYTLWHTPHQESVDALAKRVGLSTRQLNRMFHKYVGLSPKAFFRITRLQQALQALYQCPLNGAALSQDLGYYDQSHFTNEFKFFLGMSSSEWIKRSNLSEDV